MYINAIRNELIHWRDAKAYRSTGIIRNTEEYKQYLKHLREDCKISLEKVGITAENVRTISDYVKWSICRRGIRRDT